ncbi:hypothetical protein [Kineococcus glutinatus]|uniref:Uncharacterized protein n=1 Tax=Kineococcus glutinatus TaxID=1070872 RepID=A0ABP9HY55_9ACTN
MSSPQPETDPAEDLGVILPTESTPRDRQEHGKMPARPSDDQLEQLVEHERRVVHGEEDTPIPPATD